MRWYPTTNFGFENATTFTLNAAATSVAVTFPTAFPTGVTPVVLADIQANKNYNNTWVHTTANTGFTFQVETADATYARTCGYMAFATA